MFEGITRERGNLSTPVKLQFPLFSEACEHSAGLGRKTNTRKLSDENLPASHVMLLSGFILSFQDYHGAASPAYVKVSSVFVCPSMAA